MKARQELHEVMQIAHKLEVEVNDAEAMREFKAGLQLWSNQYPAKALGHIRRAAELEKQNPYFLSYLGLLTAITQRKWAEGAQLCEAALRMKRNQPQLYLNLSEVYLKAGRKEEAVDILRLGIQIVGRDNRLRTAMHQLGNRRESVLPFLGRGHALNIALGKIRHRAMRMLGVS